MSSPEVSVHPLVADCRTSLPSVSSGPRLSGSLKVKPEDFRVEEIPAYLPSGAGDHLFLYVEKSDVPAFALVDALARECAVNANDIGVAGMKDARAITRQWVSVPLSAQAALDAGGKERLAAQRVVILEHRCHGHKLRTGHLRGNRFDLLVRDIDADSSALDHAIAGFLQDTKTYGVINAFGSQRFGFQGATVELGLGVLGIEGVRRAPRLNKSKLRLALSAVQSALFNAFVKERLRSNSLYEVQRGDVAMVTASGGPFVVDDASEVNERLARKEAVLAGPMFGAKMRAADGIAQEQETALLERFGLSLSVFASFAKLAQGTRRACVVWPEDVQASREGERDMRVRFTLPSGSYATELLGQWLTLTTPLRAS